MTERGALIRPVQASAQSLRQLAYAHPRSFPVLLDSSAIGPLGDYSILAAYPDGLLQCSADGALHAVGLPIEPATLAAGGFLDALQSAWRRAAAPAPGSPGQAGSASGLAAADRSPFLGGWMVFLSYEIAAEVEPQLRLPAAAAAASAPVALAWRIPAALVLDHRSGEAWALAEPGRDDLLQALQAALESHEQVVDPTWRPQRLRELALQELGLAGALAEEAPERFEQRVRRALEYIRAGDIYQANLSRPWRARYAATAGAAALAAALYERLRLANPAPFAGLAQHGGWHLLCSSPERLVRVRDRSVETRPIAGTRPRSRQAGEDARELAALIANPKERAEHVMLIDLERNDLGRICEAGSVLAEPMMFTESYAHVHHIVSSVSGRLRADVTPIDVLRAVFPGGTITGCPKFRCMQIIAELEAEPRGAYTGGLGFINHDGSMDMNILIRSLTLGDGVLELRAGAGIVADSNPLHELEETRAKARGLLTALPDALQP